MSRNYWINLGLALLVLLTSCNKISQDPVPEPTPPPIQEPDPVTYTVRDLSEMTLREKIGQMINVRPETLEGSTVPRTGFDLKYRETFKKFPVGGFTLFAANITSPGQVSMFTEQLHSFGDYPLLCIDEEGGTVARIGRNVLFGVITYENMYSVGSTGNKVEAYMAGQNIGDYLFKYQFDVDFAPVADVFTNPNNKVIGKRAFSSDPTVAAEMSSQFLLGLKDKKVEGCLKHFPGHGDTDTDTHTGYAETLKSWNELLECEMIPFKKGIEAGARVIMTAHVAAPNITGDAKPASLSQLMLTEKLRKELGYKGIIITDAIEMGAIANNYHVGEACLLAIEAGVDILLLPLSLDEVFGAITKAVEDGRITEKRIDESVERILQLKRDILKSRGIWAEN